MSSDIDRSLKTLITASHVCHKHAVFDAYGHISIRNPENSSTFFLSRSIAPALIESFDDLREYHVENGQPVDVNAEAGYVERFIHSEILKKFPHINSVVHSHSPDVLPFSISDVPLKASTHMDGFLGTSLQLWITWIEAATLTFDMQ